MWKNVLEHTSNRVVYYWPDVLWGRNQRGNLYGDGREDFFKHFFRAFTPGTIGDSATD